MAGLDPALIGEAARAAGAIPGRRRDSNGDPGGLVELAPDTGAIIVGDLHGCRKHFEAILADENNLPWIETGTAALVLLGDIPHDDRPDHLRDMEESIDLLERVISFTVEHPGKVIHLRGNHDTFDPRVSKGGVLQGRAFHEAVLRTRGRKYAYALEEYFEALPVFLVGRDFAAVHAGPPRGGCGREELADAALDRRLYDQLIWNRCRGASPFRFPQEYGAADVEKTRRLLGLRETAPFIVGHSPLWDEPSDIPGLWMDALGITNHHILYSGYHSSAPYFSVREGVLLQKTAD